MLLVSVLISGKVVVNIVLVDAHCSLLHFMTVVMVFVTGVVFVSTPVLHVKGLFG